ncbi:MAG: hypothetical protein ABGX90_04590 [Brachybacterium sp.]|uniref:hypothetical protein n=1 Tax=Brachybacterium sp. TaxID=1891286 RepID=UPI00324278AF
MLLGACGVVTDPPAGDDEATPAVAAEAQATEDDETGTESGTTTGATPAESADSSAASTESAEASPEEEPEVAPEPEPAEPQSFSGTGSEVVMLDPLGEDVFYAAVTHDGSSNIALWSVDENGQDIDLLVNEIGGYEGKVALNFGEDPAALRIEADGAWTIDLVHLSEAPRWDGEGVYEDRGDSVLIVDGVADGLTPVTLTHDGESNFAIWAWGESYPDLIVNDIGAYDGTTLLPDGTLVLQVDADGTWTISPS